MSAVAGKPEKESAMAGEPEKEGAMAGESEKEGGVAGEPKENKGRIRPRAVLLRGAVLTALMEGVTLFVRFGLELSAAEYIEKSDPPLLLQMHHFFWALPLLAVAALLRFRGRSALWLLAAAFGLMASDLLHHLVFLPLLAGETGWHWP